MSMNAAKPGRPHRTVAGIVLPRAGAQERQESGIVPGVAGKVIAITVLRPSTAPGGKQG